MASPSGQQSEISCHTCRRRKVKCDRSYPHCQVCEQTMQACTYPPGPLKPGPKLGSLRQRKRSRATATIDDGPEPAAAAPYRERNESPTLRDDAANDGILLLTAGAQNVSSAAEAKALDLSFILHPAHAASPPENEDLGPRKNVPGDTNTKGAIQKACRALGVELKKEAEQLLTAYFDNMVAINLFHEPTFSEKLSQISSPALVVALLAAMFAFAVRFRPGEADVNQRATRFLKLALQNIDNALEECGDNTPPLCPLQTCVVAAHCQLTQGVLGRAWRTLGMCVRLAYEMNLHLVDVQSHGDFGNSVDIQKWCEDEEKRRAWWAIWEMDVFATTIRRTPTALDWSQMEILLPVDDEAWFDRKPQASCFFEPDPMCRWKALDNCGNQSPKAWFIVINSLMKEAQRISSPRGIPSGSRSDHVDDARHRLEIIANAVRCFQLALPGHLKYNNQYLTFDARVPGQTTSSRQMHCSIYNIHLMTQLARLMIHRYDVFKGRFRVALSAQDGEQNSGDGCKEDDQSSAREYFDAADNMLAIINRSSDDHVQHINPFLLSTIWLASAVQLMRSQLCRPGALKSAIKSRYEVLNLTYKRCSRFWDMHTAVQQNLETLEEQLEARKQAERHTPGPSGSNTSTRQYGLHMPSSLRPSESANAATNNEINGPTASSPRQRASNPESAALPSPPQSHIMPSDAWQADRADDATNASMLDFLPLQGMDSQPMPSQFISATLVDPMFLFGTNTPSVDFNRLWEMEPFGCEAPQLDIQDMRPV